MEASKTPRSGGLDCWKGWSGGMNLLDVSDKFASIGSFLLALAIAIIAIVRYVRRERSSPAVRRTSVLRLRRVAFGIAGLTVAGLLILAVLADLDYAFFATYLSVAFVLGDLLGQTVRGWVYSTEEVDATIIRLRRVDRASMAAWIILLVLLEIGLSAMSAQYSKGAQLFFQVLVAVACVMLTYYPYHFELRTEYGNRQNDVDPPT